jgi:L-lactate utilization protein LutB
MTYAPFLLLRFRPGRARPGLSRRAAQIYPPFDPLGAANWIGAKNWTEMVKQLMPMFGTMCGRCVINCPMGVDTRQIVRTARAMLTAIDMTPAGLKATVDVHLEAGNNMGVTEEDFTETIQWMEEELQKEVEDSSATIPLNKKHARVIYTFNPREVKYFPYLIQARQDLNTPAN